jgi:hypothetical protein
VLNPDDLLGANPEMLVSSVVNPRGWHVRVEEEGLLAVDIRLRNKPPTGKGP